MVHPGGAAAAAAVRPLPSGGHSVRSVLSSMPAEQRMQRREVNADARQAGMQAANSSAPLGYFNFSILASILRINLNKHLVIGM